MRIEVDGAGRRIVCGHIYPASEIKVGSQWVSSGSNIVTVTKVDEHGEVFYDQRHGLPHHKSSFSFQCRYCLILEDGHDGRIDS